MPVGSGFGQGKVYTRGKTDLVDVVCKRQRLLGLVIKQHESKRDRVSSLVSDVIAEGQRERERTKIRNLRSIIRKITNPSSFPRYLSPVHIFTHNLLRYLNWGNLQY